MDPQHVEFKLMDTAASAVVSQGPPGGPPPPSLPKPIPSPNGDREDSGNTSTSFSQDEEGLKTPYTHENSHNISALGTTPEVPAYAALALQQDMEPDECSICLEQFSSEDPALLTACGHTFHLQCIIQWSHRSRECPMCLKKLRMTDETVQELLGTGSEEAMVRPLQAAEPSVPEREADLVRMLNTLALEAQFSRIRQEEVERGEEAGALLQRMARAQHGLPSGSSHRHHQSHGSHRHRDREGDRNSSRRDRERDRERERITREVEILLYQQQQQQQRDLARYTHVTFSPATPGGLLTPPPASSSTPPQGSAARSSASSSTPGSDLRSSIKEGFSSLKRLFSSKDK